MTQIIPEGWRSIIGPAMDSPEGRRLDCRIAATEAKGHVIYPPPGQRLRALELTSPEQVKVVILGQDPYHRAGQAHGLAFSVPEGTRVPPSLANIHKELRADLGIDRGTGNLEGWARQGVLLLNTVLTVEEGRAGSHQGLGWETITDAIVAAVAARSSPVVFMLWGRHARDKAARVAWLGPRTHHLVLEAPHPSPLSAHTGFLGSRPFSQANTFLERNGRGAIDWSA